MQTAKVGIREFRTDMAGYIASSTPVAITRHGHTVGFFIPAIHQQAESDIAALRKASATLDRLMAAHHVDLEAVVADFKKAKKRKAASSKGSAGA